MKSATINGTTPNSVGVNRSITNGTHVNGSTTNRAHVHGSSTSNGISPDAKKTNGTSTSGVKTKPVEPVEPIAICGMACRLPGALHSPEQLWEFLVAGGDARRRVPASRYNIDAYLTPTAGKAGMINTEYGYFLDDSIDLATLDTSFFSMRRAELEKADPQQRQILEVVRECIEDAGETNWRGQNIGCYVGNFGEDWTEIFAKDPQQYGQYRTTGFGDFMLPSRISYEFDLRGPSMIIRTACSASMIALHEACQSIGRGDCTSAIIGGVNLILAPGMTTNMAEQGVLAADGSCKTFSADANGYARGEAVNALYIKPLADAIRDGNPIRAVIRATASNSDGKSPQGGSAPNAEAQEALMRRAYELAGLDFSKTGYVECHGTGTPVGDPIETDAVARVFGEDGVYITSIKPNLGHSEGASGITSVMKAVLSLEHQIIPPNIKFSAPSPKIPWESGKLKVPLEPTPWPKNRAERVSVNSFGIGGSNAHIVIDSARSFNVPSLSKPATDTPQLLVYSANAAESLKKLTANYSDFVEKHPDSIKDLAYTLSNKRVHLPHRAFAIANRYGAGTVSPLAKVGQTPNVVMVFTGQGAQWPLMGRELLTNPEYSVFRESIQALDKYLQAVPFAPDWRIEEELRKPAKTSRMHTAELSQPLCTALQIALVDTLASVGVKPSGVVGHSSGEIAAAYAVGALSAKDAITIAFYRGKVTKKQTKEGAMAAIGMGPSDVERFIVPGVRVACENSPKSVTLSGDANKVEEVVAAIRESDPEVLARMLKVDKAYHSHHMVEIGDDYHALIENITATDPDPTKLLFSSVTGTVLTEGTDLGARYWQKNLESPVLFSTAVASVIKHELGKNAVFLEIGPHSALAGPIRQTQAEHSNTAAYVSTMSRAQNGIETFLTAVGKLYTLNVPIAFEKLISNGATLPNLPRYPWNHSETFWYESRLSKEWRHRQHAYHELLGVRVSEATDLDPAWRNLFHLDNAPWIRDHKVQEDIVFPFVGYAGIIGEAVRQISGVQEGFTLRHVVISSALTLTEEEPTEIMTSFRRHRLTDQLDSQWWEFSIASHNGQVWQKHCVGQVRGQAESLGKAQSPPLMPRKVTSRRCYESMRQSGIDFGPSFQLLKDVRSSTTEQLARARVDAVETPAGSSHYFLHPTLIDNSMQLLAIASTKGFAHQGKSRMLIPTAIKELSVSNCASGVDILASASILAGGNVDGEVESSSQGNVVLRISGLRLTALGDDDQDAQSDTTARAEWGPHIDFLDAKPLLQRSIDRSLTSPLLKELSELSIVYSHRQTSGLKSEVPHLNRYHGWIERQAKSLAFAQLAKMSNESIEKRVDSLVSELSNSPAVDAATAIMKIFSHIKEIITGEAEPLEVLLADDTLNKLYRFTDEFDRSSFLQHLTHSKPNLRVLEVGAGTGASTRTVLKDLAPSDERILYSKYTFTDISAGLLFAAKENLKTFPNMEYATLDISQDPAEQGFEDRQFDLILATNVIHATKSLRDSLENIQKLLHPQGRLLLTELNPSSKWVNYIWGTLQGWWLGEQDGRTDEPYVTPERWERELVAAGFRGLEAVQLDSEEPHQLNAMMVARPKSIATKEKRVTLLSFDKASKPGPILSELEKKGYSVTQHWLTDDTSLPAGQDAIAFLDQDQPFFDGIEDTNFELFQRLIGSISGSGIMWITKLSQIHCADPRWAQTIGIARTVRSEFLIPFATCEVDDLDSSLDLAVDVFDKFRLRADDESLDPEFEYAIHNRSVNVGRIYPFSLQKTLLTSEASDKVFLHTDKPGRVGDLHWSRTAVRNLEGDAVEVEIHSAGLNFKDVLCAMGIVEPNEEGFGLEGSGAVRRIGPNVKNLHVGDRVMLIGHCMFATTALVSEERCVKMPDSLEFEDAATMPCVYTTSIYSLFDVGNLQKGQSILIHSACGGVGIASIQLAKMAGAEIYVTVGNEEKVQHLMTTFNLPRNRIFNSRNTSFVNDLMRETNGKGVDLALNSLSGELLHATWECIAEFGKMVEIGKRDLLGAGKLDLGIFLGNRSYCCVDLDQICFKKPALCQELLQRTIDLFKAGHILPIRPIRSFKAASIHDAFRYMQQGQHLGKIVISMRDSSKAINFGSDISERKQSVKFDSSAYYLLVGGLGGLGRSISTWMVECGARHLIYLSRSAVKASTEHQDFIAELDSLGCQVQMVQGSVSNLDDVTRAVEQAQGHLKGILQMSMVLRDQALTKMTLEEWNSAVQPKVTGTWNLHNATLSMELDFFVLFSSISGVIGQPGQANYAGANTFLDAFVHYRNGLGLPISAVDIGAVEEVGYVSRNENLLRRLKNSGAYGIVSERELLDSMAASMTCLSTNTISSTHNATKLITKNNFALGLRSAIPLSSSDNRAVWRRDIRMAIFHNSGAAATESTGAANNVLKTFLAKAKNDPSIIMNQESIHLLAMEIGRKLFSFLLKPEEDLQISLSLADLGMDSLVAIELRSWWKQTFGFEVKVLEMMGMGTLEALGQHAAEGLQKRAPVESDESGGSN